MGTVYLGTILHNQGYDVRIYNENIMSGILDPFSIEADVFCISALTVSANRALLLAHEIKHVNADSRVVVGGIHASLVPEDFTEIADQVVVGEAEGIITDVVEGLLPGKVVHGTPLENLDDLFAVPRQCVAMGRLLDERMVREGQHVLPRFPRIGQLLDQPILLLCPDCAIVGLRLGMLLHVGHRRFVMLTAGRPARRADRE